MADGRGKHPNSRNALEENRTCFCGETAVKAAKKKHEVEREYKTLKELARENFTPERKLGWLIAMAEKADTGDAKAFEILRDTMGEKPTDSVELTGGMALEVELTVVE